MLFIILFLGWWGMGVLVGSVYVFVLDYVFLSFLYMFAFDRCFDDDYHLVVSHLLFWFSIWFYMV